MKSPAFQILAKEERTVPDTIYIRMLGKFELRQDGRVLSDSVGRSYQLWNLLEYLVAHRDQHVPQDELIEILWPDENSDNPGNALKNLIYRIRGAFTDAGFTNGKEMVCVSRGSYFLNPNYEYVVDAEEFETCCKQATRTELSEEERLKALQEALRLYRGDFLPKSAYENWVVPLSTYYRSLFLRTAKHAVALLAQSQRHEDVLGICEQALTVEQFDEDFYVERIRALIALGRQKEAMECYQEVSELFYREMGVHLSERLRNLYREIIKTVNMVETDLQIIKDDLREAEQATGAFVCEYEVFKNMYRLEARSAERTGNAAFLALFTLTTADGSNLDTHTHQSAMRHLLEALVGSLRRSDVLARFSATQYVTLLFTLSYENGCMVLDRISRRFNNSYRNPKIKLITTLQPLDPIQ